MPVVAHIASPEQICLGAEEGRQCPGRPGRTLPYPQGRLCVVLPASSRLEPPRSTQVLPVTIFNPGKNSPNRDHHPPVQVRKLKLSLAQCLARVREVGQYTALQPWPEERDSGGPEVLGRFGVGLLGEVEDEKVKTDG